MSLETISLTVPKPYSFAASVCDHGWPALAPFRWDETRATLERVERLDDKTVVLLHIKQGAETEQQIILSIVVHSAQPLTANARDEVTARVRWMLKLDQDYRDFYRRAATHARIRRVVGQGRGRLLRSPTLWEDVVKTIATTNVTWRNTVGMIERLVTTLGDPFPLEPTRHAFPTPQQVAAADPVLFAETIRMGYRNSYVQQLARELASSERTLDAQTLCTLPTAALKTELKSLKGIGDYAAHTLLMLLGHYGELPVDSEYRSFVHRHYFPTTPADALPDDKHIATLYDDWGAWKYLAYWFDHYD